MHAHVTTHSDRAVTRQAHKVTVTHCELFELLLALAGSPEDPLQLAASCQDVSSKGKVRSKLMHHCA